jgi:hypothetical protein
MTKSLTQPQTTARLSGWQGGGQGNTAKEKAKEGKSKLKLEPGNTCKMWGFKLCILQKDPRPAFIKFKNTPPVGGTVHN